MSREVKFYRTSPALGEPMVDVRIDEAGNVWVAYSNDVRAAATLLRFIADDMEKEARS